MFANGVIPNVKTLLICCENAPPAALYVAMGLCVCVCVCVCVKLPLTKRKLLSRSYIEVRHLQFV